MEERPGFLLFSVTGKRSDLFLHEGGGVRWQRQPPTEKRGRVHTSTVTVAVLRPASKSEVKIDLADVELSYCRGSGAGGQHRNVTESAVQAHHKPTGLRVRAESERSQKANKEAALAILRARLALHEDERYHTERNAKRRKQVGSGMRADKARTVAEQRDEVVDHRAGKRTTFKKYKKGEFPGLW